MYQLPCYVCGEVTPTVKPKPKRCPSCTQAEMRDYSRWYYNVHREEMREYHRFYHINNRERILARLAARRVAKRRTMLESTAFSGSAIRNSDGTTSYFGPDRKFRGSSTNTTQSR